MLPILKNDGVCILLPLHMMHTPPIDTTAVYEGPIRVYKGYRVIKMAKFCHFLSYFDLFSSLKRRKMNVWTRQGCSPCNMLIRALEILKIPSLVQKLWAIVVLTPNGSAIAGLIKQDLVRQQLTNFSTLGKISRLNEKRMGP